MSFLKVKVRWVIIDNSKVFLCRLSTGWFYCLPWWTLEKWETLEECLEREFIEELWVKPIIWDVIYTQQFFSKNKETTWIDFWYKINNPDDYKNIDLSKTTHWFELSEVWFYDLDKIENYKPTWLKEILFTKKL